MNVHIASEDLQKALNDINKYKTEVKKAVKKEILRTGYAVVNKAKINLTKNKSVKTGRLRSSLNVEGNVERGQVKAGTKVEYAAYLEFGTPAHIIRVKTKNVLARYTGTSKGKAGFEIFGKEVRHPGTKAKPFLFPAAESERKQYEGNILKIIGNDLRPVR